jgi:cellulose synthase/poly-beta-1,6-N-acetylglucosamine synthase-like glycosyltransferase
LTIVDPAVSIVVPVRNAERTVHDCIASLLRLDYPATRREIIAVDNGSSDASPAIIRGLPVTRVMESRRGPSWARNAGIGASGGEIIAFTDADCVVTAQWLRELVAGFRDDDGAWAVAGEILPFAPQTHAERYMARRQSRWQAAALRAPRPYMVTANVAFRRQTFDHIGRFDARFPIGQDQDLGWRFFSAGLRCRYAPAAVVLHRHRHTTWAFFKQQLGWGYGAALLRQHHRLPWGPSAELRELRELVRAAHVLLVVAGRAAFGAEPPGETAYRFHDVLREAARRAGSLRAAVEHLSLRKVHS